MDARYGRALEVARIDDEADQPTLVLGGGGMGGDKDELPGMTLRPKVMHTPDAGLQIVLKQAVGADKRRIGYFRQHHRIRIAVGLAGPALVNARKILRVLVEHVTTQAPFDRIDRPALERPAWGIRPQHGLG